MAPSAMGFPRSPCRSRSERDLARRVTGGRRALRPRVPRESQKKCAGNQRQRCRCSPNELAYRKHWQSLAPGRARRHNWLKSWQKLPWNWKLHRPRSSGDLNRSSIQEACRPERRDCVAGHRGFELTNPHANHAFEVSREFLAISRKSGIRDFSRTSCTQNTCSSPVVCR